MSFFNRLKKAELEVRSRLLDSAIFVHQANIQYLCSFTGSSGSIALAGGKWAFFTDGRYGEQAKFQVKNARIYIGSSPPSLLAAEWTARRLAGLKRPRIGIEGDHVTLSAEKRIHSYFRSNLGKSNFRLIPTSRVVEELRTKKEESEVRLIREAVRLGSHIFSGLLNTIRSSTTENEIAAELEYLARSAGAEKMSFDSIVASGPNSALPHARPTRRKIGRGFVVLDYGVILAGYCSDMARTVWVGRATGEARQIYSAVLEAQLAAIAAVAPGVEAQAVDGAARDVLRKHKLDKYFTHSLGHGVGLEIHEAPRLAKAQTQKLEPGMVITIEPGVYIPGKGGVRIEDMVLVTKTGCEVLTLTPKEFLVL